MEELLLSEYYIGYIDILGYKKLLNKCDETKLLRLISILLIMLGKQFRIHLN